MGWVGFSAVIGGRVPLNILYPSPPRGSGRGASPRWRWVFSAVLISGACFFSHRGADGNQLSQGKFVISVVTAVVSISRSSEPLPFHLRPPPLLSFAHVLSHFGSRRVNIFTFSLCLRPSFCPLLMAEARQKAHEFCSFRHLEKTILGTTGASEIAEMLGFPDQDIRWCTPWGQDVTDLCEFSDNGGYGSQAWTIHGWILDESSMRALKEEYPDECLERPEHR